MKIYWNTKIDIGFEHGIHTTLESFAILFDEYLVWCWWCYYNPFFSSSLFQHNNQVRSAIVTKCVAFWLIRWPDVRGDVVAEIVWQTWLNSHDCVIWCTFFLLEIDCSTPFYIFELSNSVHYIYSPFFYIRRFSVLISFVIFTTFKPMYFPVFVSFSREMSSMFSDFWCYYYRYQLFLHN